MIVLKNGQKLQVVLGDVVTTNQLQCFAVWRNITSSAYAADSNPVATNDTTDVDLIGDPGASAQNVADYISVYNADTVSATVTFKIDVSGTEKIVHVATLGVGEKVEYVDGAGWRKYNAAGTLIEATSGGPTDVQSAAVAGAGTWTKPTSFTPKFVRVILYGAGGGGGGGASNTGGVVRCGGAGGGGGARAERTYLASDLAGTVGFVLGAGGLSGTAGASGADGGAGGIGGTSTFGSTVTLLSAYGGGGGCLGDNASTAGAGGSGGGLAAAGAVGTTSAATGGGPGAPGTPNGGCGANSFASSTVPAVSEYGGGAGGGHTNVPANGPGGGSLFGGAGGGCGGGANVSPAVVQPGAGGSYLSGSGGGGGAAGTSGPTPTAGSNGTNGTMYRGGYGGGGGGSTVTAATNGMAGGNGGTHGGGGGGGGSGSNTGTGGAGGVGGAGAIYVISW